MSFLSSILNDKQVQAPEDLNLNLGGSNVNEESPLKRFKFKFARKN